MAFSFSRMLIKEHRMSLVAISTRKSLRAHAYNMSCCCNHHPIQGKQQDFSCEEYTPHAWKAIQDAKLVATEMQQRYVQPECLIISLLDQKGGIANDLLVKARCNVASFKEILLGFMKKQPKTTDMDFVVWQAVTAKYYTFLSMIGKCPLPHPQDSYLQNEGGIDPVCRLNPLLWSANKEMDCMRDDLMGEEHFLLAYHEDRRFGRKVFSHLNVRKSLLKEAAREIRSDLKMKNEVKEEEKTGIKG